jgi:hypothetical protein
VRQSTVSAQVRWPAAGPCGGPLRALGSVAIVGVWVLRRVPRAPSQGADPLPHCVLLRHVLRSSSAVVTSPASTAASASRSSRRALGSESSSSVSSSDSSSSGLMITAAGLPCRVSTTRSWRTSTSQETRCRGPRRSVQSADPTDSVRRSVPCARIRVGRFGWVLRKVPMCGLDGCLQLYRRAGGSAGGAPADSSCRQRSTDRARLTRTGTSTASDLTRVRRAP